MSALLGLGAGAKCAAETEDGGGGNGGMLRAANQRRSTPADSASRRSDLSQDRDLEAMLIIQICDFGFNCVINTEISFILLKSAHL